jgi:hypothetical protein
MPKHIHADLIMKYAEIAQESEAPWDMFEWFDETDECWSNCKNYVCFHSDTKYRLKPKTIRIGEYDVPEPIREPLKCGDKYFTFSLTNNLVESLKWCGDCTDNLLLSVGFIHLTPEAAVLHCKALRSFTKQ